MLQHPVQPALCPCPMAKGVQCPSEEFPSLLQSSDSGSSLPKLCLLTELNLQFHGLVTMSLVYKIHELLGSVERRGEKHLGVSKDVAAGTSSRVLLWGTCGAQRWGARASCRTEGCVPTGGEVLDSPGNNHRVFTCTLCRASLGWPSESHWRNRNPFRDGTQGLSWQGLSLFRDPAAGLEFEFVVLRSFGWESTR